MRNDHEKLELSKIQFTCNMCGQHNYTIFFENQDLMHGMPGSFRVVQCPNCQLIALNPQPENLSVYYPLDKYHAYISKLKKPEKLKNSISRSHLKRANLLVPFLSNNVATPYVLDIGCGEGAFLRATMLTDLEKIIRIGVDFNYQASRISYLHNQIDTGTCDSEKLSFENESFDIVTMWHVLEHVRNPRRVLLEVKRVLKPNGKLVIACPVVDSFEARLFGKYWAGFDVPRHLHTFSRETLGLMLKNNGFNFYEVKGIIKGWYSIRTSCQFVLGSGGIRNIIASLLAWFIFLIGRLFFRAPSVAVFVVTPSNDKTILHRG